MIVTALTPLRGGRVGLHLDGGFVCALHPLEAAPLRVGGDMDEDTLQALQEATDRLLARERALSLLALRAYTCAGLYEKLAPDFGGEAAAATVERMLELGYLDDEDYARRLTGELTRKGLAAEYIVRELVRRGIGRDLARDIVEAKVEDPELAAARVVKRKYMSALYDEKGRRRVAGALARLGYRHDVIHVVIAHLSEDEGYYDGPE